MEGRALLPPLYFISDEACMRDVSIVCFRGAFEMPARDEQPL